MTDILAIDPGSRRAGIVFFRDGRLHACSLFQDLGDHTLPVRIESLVAQYSDFVLDQCGPGPECEVIIEWPPHMQGRPGQEYIYALIGAFCLESHEFTTSSHIQLVQPREWKQAVVGNVSAKKPEIKAALQALYANEVREVPAYRNIRADVWDALGLATYWLQKQRLEARAQVVL